MKKLAWVAAAAGAAVVVFVVAYAGPSYWRAHLDEQESRHLR